MMKKPEEGFDVMAPENVAPLVAWLASAESKNVTGRVFEMSGGTVSLAEGWGAGVKAEKGDRWDATELGAVVRDLVERGATPRKAYGA
jgi:drug/metabolite transporter superfamily protein YnfA